MSEELSRHKEALKVYQTALRELGLDFAQFTAMVEKRVAAVLEPAPEFEEKVAEVWAVIDTSSGKIWNTGTKEEMEVACSPSPANLLKVIQLTGPYQRPIRRAVIREYEVAAKIGALGDVIGVGLTSRPFLDQPECHGKAGVLIFRTAE